MPTKIVMFFSDGEFGGSETYYSSSNDVETQLINLRPNPPGVDPLSQLVEARLAILEKHCSLDRVRVSLEGAFRVADAVDIPIGLGLGKWVNPIEAAGKDQAEDWTDLLVRFVGSTLAGQIVHKQNFLFGVPEVVVSAAQLYTPPASFILAMLAFIKRLTGGGFLIKSRPVLGAAVPITSFATSADGLTAYVLPNVMAGSPAKQAVLRGIKNPHGWNGTHRAVDGFDLGIPPVPATVIGPIRKAGVTVPLWQRGQGGTIAPLVSQYPAITNGEVVRITEHHRGRPFGAPRGRRSRP